MSVPDIRRGRTKLSANRSMHLASAMTVAAVLMMASPACMLAAEEPAPSTFVALTFEGPCDNNNNRLWLVNNHTFKTIATTVRWRAAGGKNLTEEFFPTPNSKREIGCAAEAEIIQAKFAEF